jgi:hypothetical protein
MAPRCPNGRTDRTPARTRAVQPATVRPIARR